MPEKPRVVAIEEDGGYSLIRLSDGKTVRAPTGVLHKLGRLAAGAEVDRRALIGEIRKHMARDRAIRLLAGSDKSGRDIARRLELDGFEQEEARDAVTYLVESGYLDEAAYAVKLARRYVEEKLFAPARARREMTAKGVGSSLADEALDGLDADLTGNMRAIVEKNRYKGRRKVMNLLYTYGYQHGEYIRIVDEYFEDDGERFDDGE